MSLDRFVAQMDINRGLETNKARIKRLKKLISKTLYELGFRDLQWEEDREGCPRLYLSNSEYKGNSDGWIGIRMHRKRGTSNRSHDRRAR